MSMPDNTQLYQSALASYCRTGILAEIPGIDTGHVTQYRRLVYNVVDDMLRNAFPLTVALLTEKQWDGAVDDFFSHHPCSSPQVWYMPREFYEYVTTPSYPLMQQYPFLKDLLWLEWSEMELFMMEDRQATCTSLGDVLFSQMVLNPEHRLLAFQYPVHQKNALEITGADLGNYFVVAHRDREGNILFTDASALLIRMLKYLAIGPASLKDLFGLAEAEFSIRLSLDLGLILGFKSSSIV
jgi:hypothetical protein